MDLRFCIGIFLLLSFLFVPSCTGGANTGQNADGPFVKVKDNWQYRFGDSPRDENNKLVWLNDSLNSEGWISFEDFREIPRRNDNCTLWIRTKLPAGKIADPAIFFDDIRQAIQVYLGDKIIYQYGNFDPNDESIPIGYKVHLISLPEDYQNKTLTLRVYSSVNIIGPYRYPYIGGIFNITKDLFLQNVDEIVLASIYTLIGTILLVVFLFTKRNKLFFGLAILLLSIGLWTGANARFLQLIFPYSYLFYFIDNISIYSFAIGPFFIAEQIIDDKYKKIIRWIWQINVAYLIISIIIEIIPGTNFAMMFDYYMLAISLVSIPGLLIMVVSAFKGNYQTRLIVIGLGFCFVFGILELLFYNWNEDAYFPVVLHIGTLFLVVMLALVLFYEYRRTNELIVTSQQKELKAVNREKETRQKYTQRLISAQEDERKRISFELHDAVGQDLLVIKNMARLIEKNIDDKIAVEDYLKDISETMEHSIKDIRDISRTLHPYELEKLGLTTALRALVARVENSSEIKFETDIANIDKVFNQADEIHIYRILQESLNNIIKHSNAKHAVVNVERTGESVSISIKDDGLGFETDNHGHPVKYGTGITGINERVQILNGSLKVNSKINEGVEINIVVPVDAH